MISKVAIQSGLGIALIGGVGGGIAVWQLDGKSNNLVEEEYLVHIEYPDKADNSLSTIILQENDKKTNQNKNYFCQWTIGTNKTERDNDCEIKQIKLVPGTTTYFLPAIIKKNNANVLSKIFTPKTENGMFFLGYLKIKGYNNKLEKMYENSGNIEIDILSTDTGNKKYIYVMPVLKLQNNQIKQGNIDLALVKYESNTKDSSIDSEFTCQLKNVLEEKKEKCYIYKFETQPTPTKKPITEFNLTNIKKISSADEIKDNHYYIIYFNDSYKNVSSLINSAMISVETQKNPNKKIGDFAIVSLLFTQFENNNFQSHDSNFPFSKVMLLH